MRRFLFLLFCVSLFIKGFGQGQNFYNYSVEAGVGQSNIGIIASQIFKVRNIYQGVTPVYGLDFLVNPNRSIAIGLGITNQHFSAAGQIDTLVNTSLEVNKFNLSAEGRFYYYNRTKFTLYSSLKVGVTLWNLKASVSTDVIENFVTQNVSSKMLVRVINGYLDKFQAVKGKFKYTLESIQFVPIGLARNFGHLGVYGQVAIGSPYFLLMGVKYRFNTNAF